MKLGRARFSSSVFASLSGLLLALRLAGAAPAPAFRFAAVNDQSLGLWDGAQPVLVYNHGVIAKPGVPADRARSTYIHPLYGLDGEVLTDDFPRDHYHHRGLFWAWPHVTVGGQHYDLWMLKGLRQQFVRWLDQTVTVSSAVLGVENGWFVGEQKVLQERVWIRVHPALANERALDLDFTWTPVDQPITLAGAENKSYGGLTLRFAPGTNTVITVPSGPTTNDLPMTNLPWADLTRQWTPGRTTSGAAIFVHPSHPDFPPQWLTRYYGVLCLGWPGIQAQTFQPGQPIRCSYRVWIHRGAAALSALQQAFQAYQAVSPPAPDDWVWSNTPPANCPFPPSTLATGLVFTGRHAEYTEADTWYPSWAADGNLYSPWTDGTVNGLTANSAGRQATTGYATILGDDPLKLQVVNHSVYPSDPAPYGSRYPCGSLVYNGVWYYGTYALGGGQVIQHEGVTYNWPWIGPFVGFRWSTDLGKTWTQTLCTPDKPLFGEQGLKGEPVKIGAPHFVDFGKNMEHSPDGKAYLTAHGASDGANRRFGFDSWITGDEIYLVRVTPGIENMNAAAQYEFYDGAGWTKDFAKIKPIAVWKDNMGCVTMTYNAPLKKYLLCVTDGGNTGGYFNSYILESDRITGPWKLLHYLYHFGEQGYFVNIPSKFISADGRTFWLCYSANFATSWNNLQIKSRPPGSRYAMCLQEVRLAPGAAAP